MKFANRLFCILIYLFLTILVISCAANNEVQKPKRVKYSTKDNFPHIDLYQLEVAYHVNQNWIMPKNSNCADTKATSIVFTIMPNGEIANIFYTEKSERKDLDDSAYSASTKSAPFQPFPNNLNVEEVKL